VNPIFHLNPKNVLITTLDTLLMCDKEAIEV